MSVQRTNSLLLHIMEDLQDIERFIFGATVEEFKNNAMLKKAVCMSLLNIGEAVNKLPEDFFSRNPDIPWKRIVGLRNRTAHGYYALDDEIIWSIANNDIGSLKNVIQRELET